MTTPNPSPNPPLAYVVTLLVILILALAVGAVLLLSPVLEQWKVLFPVVVGALIALTPAAGVLFLLAVQER